MIGVVKEQAILYATFSLPSFHIEHGLATSLSSYLTEHRQKNSTWRKSSKFRTESCPQNTGLL